MKRISLPFASIFLTVSLLAALSSRAASVVWTNGAGGNWNVMANWSPNNVPSASDSVFITNNGTYSVTNNASVVVANLTVGGTAGTQTFVLNGNSLTLNGVGAMGPNCAWNFSGGTLNGSGSLAVGGPFAWTGGTLSISGGVALNGASSFSSTTFEGMIVSCVVSNAGALTWSGTGTGGNAENLYISGSFALTNLTAGTITITSDVSTLGGGTLGNAGMLTKTGGTGTTTLNQTFVNSGTLNIQSGTISLNANSTQAGVITNVSGTTLNFVNGTHTVAAGFNATGPGSIVLSGGTVNFNNAGGSTLPNLTLSGGDLGGTGGLAINGALGWTAGTINNSAGVTLNGASSLSGTTFESMALQGPLINAGALTWSGTGTGGNSENLYIGGSFTLTNLAAGTVTITSDVSTAGGGTFGNAGAVTKTGDTGTTTFSQTFVNSGTLDVESGNVVFNANSTQAGGVTIASGSTVSFTGGTHTVGAGFSATGPGSIVLSGGTINFNNAGGSTLPNLTLSGGDLGGTGALAINGPLNWTVGTINNSAGVTLNGASSLNGSTYESLVLQGLLINAGALTWSGTGTSGNSENLYIGGSFTLTNLAAGTVTITSDVSTAGSGTFGNAGAVTKTGGTNTTTFSQTFVNSGTVGVQSGNVVFNANSTQAGGVTIASGSTVSFTGGTHTVVAGFSVTGTGGVLMSGGTVNFNNVAGSALPNLTLSGGDLGGTGGLAINGPFSWTGGTINNSAGVTLNGASSFNGPTYESLVLSGLLINAGTLTWSGSGVGGNLENLYISGGWTLTNLAAGTVTIAADVSTTGSGTFGNAGVVTKTGGVGTTTFAQNLVNTGTLDVQSGTVSLSAASTQAGAVIITNGSTLSFVSGTHSVVAGFSATGPGSLVISGGTVNFNIAAGITVPNLTLTSGDLGGTGGLTLSGPFTWSGGSINNSSGVKLDGPSTLNGTVFESMVLSGLLANAGAMTWSGGGSGGNADNLYISGGAILTNLAAGTITVTTDVSSVGPGLFGNAGVLAKNGTTGTTTVNGPFVNSGTLSAQSGTISLGGSHTLVQGTLNFGINGLTNYGIINLSGNAALTGTLSANLNGGYIPNISNAFPVLTFGTYSQGFTGTNLPSLAVWQTTYNPANVTITLLRYIPILTWPKPADIVYGTVLGGSQLDASAVSPTNLGGGLAGTFTYAPPAGTGLLPGSNQNLSVLFTPADLTQYTNTSTNTTINVQKAPLTVTANNTNKIYGQTVTFAGTEFKPTGLVFSDSVTSATLTSAGGPVTATVAGSPYNIVPSAALPASLTSKYIITYQNGQLTVNPAPLAVTANSRGKVYGQTSVFAGTEFTAKTLFNSDTVTNVTLTSAGAPATALVAGSPYNIVPSAAQGAGLGNYTISYLNGGLTVSPAPLTVTANNRIKTYGQAVTFAGTEFNTAGLRNSDAVNSVTLTSAGAAATAVVAGSPFTITASAATGTGLANYSITYAPGNLTVNPAALTVTANARAKTYGQAVTFTGTEFTTMGLANSDAVNSVTLTSGGAPANAAVAGSTYNIVPSAATGTGLGNYTLAYANGLMTVNPAPLTVTANAQSKTYGGTVAFGSGSTLFGSVGLQNLETIGTVTLAVSGSGGAGTAPVGSSPYTITPSAATGGTFTPGNYSITYAPGNLTVNPAPLTITATAEGKTYGQTITFGSGSTFFKSVGLQNLETIGSVTLAVSGSGGAGTAPVSGSPYSLTPSAATGGTFLPGNYTITYVAGNLNVNPAALTVTANNRTKTYGQLVTFAGTEFTTGALLNGDTVTGVTLTSTGAAANASVAGSTYNIVPSAATGTGVGNYTITYVNGLMTVNPTPLTVTANAESKTYGATLAFGSGSALFGSAGLQNLETIGSVTLAVSGSGGAGTAPVSGSPYTIMPSAATGGTFTAGNYSITYANGNLTITPAALTITATTEGKTYGQAITFGSGSTFFKSVGLQNLETIGSVTLAVSGNGGAATATVAGSPYTLTPSAATGGTFLPANYNIAYANGNLNVNPAALTVTANNRTKTYGQLVTFAGTEFTTGALLNGDTVTGVTLTSGGAAANASVAGSTYNIVPSAATGTGVGNYTITYVNGLLTVNPAPLTVTADNLIKIYGELVTFAGTEFTTGALLNGDTVTSVTLTSAGAAANATVADSPYNIVPSAAQGSGVGNYAITYADGVLTVANPELTIESSPPSVILSWTTNATAFVLNGTGSLAAPTTWKPVPGKITVVGTSNTLTINASGDQFYTLIAP